MEEQKLQTAIHRLTGMETFKDPYADEYLTPEEIRDATERALREARRQKAVARYEKEYLNKISQPVVYPKFESVDEFKGAIFTKIKQKHPDYIIDEYNEKQFHLFALYFLGDPEFEKIDGGVYSLNKGIYTPGPIGCGKTTMLGAFNINPTNPFVITTCRKISQDFSLKDAGGSLALEKYSGLAEVIANDYFGHRFVGRLFDDIGTEGVSKHFGNESNVIAEILMNRYENKSLVGKTHVTSNISAETVESVYGSRVRSRLREMCNMIPFDIKAPDRRQ